MAPIPITYDNYSEFIPTNWASNTGYIQRYNDCYILHPALSATVYPTGADATNQFITTPVIYFDTGIATEDQSAARSSGGMGFRINMLAKTDGYPTTIPQMAARGMTLLLKYGVDGDANTAGNLKYSTTGNTYRVTNGVTGYITAGFGMALGIPAKLPIGTTGATGTYTFFITNSPKGNCYTYFEEAYYLWRVQICLGHRVGSDPLYTGPALIMDGNCAWFDITSRGNSGGTYFHNFDGYAMPYDSNRVTHPTTDSGAGANDADPGNWPIEYTP
jgi:hypothetical protein